MFQILFILYIETFPNNAPYFPNNAPCFPMDKDVELFINTYRDLGSGSKVLQPNGRLQ